MRLVSTKMSVRPVVGMAANTSSSTDCLSRSSTNSIFCVMFSDVEPTRPTDKNTYSFKKSLASIWIFCGNVAENMSVWRSITPGISSPSTMRRICGSKPMSSMRSASSSTRKRTFERLMRPRSIISTRRPGVADRRSQPRSIWRSCAPISAPPYTTAGRTHDRYVNLRASS